MKEKKLTCTFHIGDKQIDKLTPEQTECLAERLSEVMSIYYTAHHDEYKQIQDKKGRC